MERKLSKAEQENGVNDLDVNIWNNGKNEKYYDTWRNMLKRCYDSKRLALFPTYIGCTVCDEWKYLSNFKKWFEDNYIEGFHLDKDILVENNKVYSPETCRFVPLYLNSLLTDSARSRGNFPRGVHLNNSVVKGKKYTYYQAACNNGNGKQLTKNFKNLDEASKWYSETKKKVVKEQAKRAFLDNAIKTDVYLALVRREF